jgi:hypothetical protein
MDGLLIDPKPQNDTPQWLQAIYKLGVPSVIALYAVYSLVNGGLTVLAQIDRAQQQHNVDAVTQTEILREMKESSRRTEGYLRLLCLNTAKTIDRASCLSLR